MASRFARNLALEPPSPRWSSVMRKFRGGASSAACSGLPTCSRSTTTSKGRWFSSPAIYSHRLCFKGGFYACHGFLCCNSFRIRHDLLDKGVLVQLSPGLPLGRPQCPAAPAPPGSGRHPDPAPGRERQHRDRAWERRPASRRSPPPAGHISGRPSSLRYRSLWMSCRSSLSASFQGRSAVAWSAYRRKWIPFLS